GRGGGGRVKVSVPAGRPDGLWPAVAGRAQRTGGEPASGAAAAARPPDRPRRRQDAPVDRDAFRAVGGCDPRGDRQAGAARRQGGWRDVDRGTEADGRVSGGRRSRGGSVTRALAQPTAPLAEGRHDPGAYLRQRSSHVRTGSSVRMADLSRPRYAK